MRTTTGSVHSHPPTTPGYSPSVPLSVYRELTAELQATQAKSDALTAKNHQLAQENQLLRQEIAKVVESCLQLQKLVDSSAAPVSPPVPRAATQAKSPTKHPANPAPPRQQANRVPPQKSRRDDFVDTSFPIREPVFIEEQEVRYYAVPKPEVKELSGWLLVFTIFFIMVTAFGAGYLVVRPLFANQNN
ncbi:hypothetical protein Cylst_1315 [Cylindrospermum stagnale PCC 7417]|uniref:Uncharacterized protein n=1 Tax=Cylindrospermum stagnale PCC 7417 TaxID=56107 RepID=K9WTC1_9NOST|nr:cell division protein ZapB [Cylindrospermum stagnale]AFZ23605.1 hypothetical protein Cylst_1315 [Cylindrospermum stagnale PCC 7417]